MRGRSARLGNLLKASIGIIAAAGQLYVAWADFPQGSRTTSSRGFRFCTNSNVRLAVSRSGGKSWTPPVKVSDETNADVLYTNTYDGATFLPNVRVSTQTSIVGTNVFVGDYQGLAATADAVFPIWDDLRLGAVAFFTAKGTLAP